MAYKNKADILQYGREYRQMCKNVKICVACKTQDAYTLIGRTYCADCAEKYAKRKREKYYASAKTIAERKEYRKKLRERHIQNHECTVCGLQLPKDYSYQTCPKCRAYNRIRERKDNSFTRGEYGICWTCNKNKVIDGKRLCQSCYDRQLKILQNIPTNKNHKWRYFSYGKNN